MRTINIRRGIIMVVLAALVCGFAAACSTSNSITPINLMAKDAITKLACDQVTNVARTVSELSEASAPGERAELREWGLDPSNSRQVDEARKDLNTRADACKQDDGATPAASGSPSESETTPPSDGEAGVEDSDGELKTLSIVDQVGTGITPADSTNDPRTPGTYADALAGGPVQNWSELVDRMGDKKWYVDGVNQRASKTGFDWDDIQQWAMDGAGYDTRLIQVYNMDISDDKARELARELIGDDADKLSIARHDCIINTRGFGHEKMQDFVDCRQMVRVTLAPLVYKENRIVGLRSDAGILVDCFNLGWVPRQVVKNGPPPTRTTPPVPTTPPTVTPPPPTRTTPPPPTTTPPSDDKVIADHPVNQGNAPRDTWNPAPAATATPSAPGGGTAPPSYSAPAPPAPTSAPTMTPRPTTAPSDPPPVVVEPEPSNSSAPPPPTDW